MFSRGEPRRSIELRSPVVPVITVLLAVIQLFFPFKGWVILLTGFGGMWLVSFLWARALQKGLQIHRDIAFGWKQVGDRLRERVQLENNTWVPGLWVHVDDRSDMRDYTISTVVGVQSWRYRNWHTQGVCVQRGLFTLGPVTLRAEDPFGIYQVEVDYTDSVNMMVVPPVVTLPEIEIATGGRVGEGRSANRGLKQTVSTIGVREYVPGDSLRWLHWPTIARTGELYVHLYENEPTSDWWVLLDLDEAVQIGEGPQSTEEHGVMLAASLVNHGLKLGKHVGLIAAGSELVWHHPERGDAHLWAVLRSLATVRPGRLPLDTILSRLRSSLGRNTSLVIITPNPDPSWIGALEHLQRLEIRPTVLLLDPQSFGGERTLEPIRGRLRKSGITHHTITADFLNRPQKEAREKWGWLFSSPHAGGEIHSDWTAFWQMARRFLRDWGLLLVFYSVFASILANAVRGMESDLVWAMIWGGCFIGSAVAFSKVPRWLAGVVSALAGILVAIVRVGNLGRQLAFSLAETRRLIPDLLSWVIGSADPPDYLPVVLRWQEIAAGGLAIGTRLWVWIAQFAQRNPFYDPVATTFLWSLAILGVVIWSVWGMFRVKKPLLGFLPPLAMAAVTLAFVDAAPYDIVFLLGVTVAATVLVHHDVLESSWLTSAIRYAQGIRRKVVITAVTLTAGLMALSLVTPSLSFGRLTEIVENLTPKSAPVDQNLVRSIGLEKKTEEVDPLDTVRVGGLPNDRLIGSGSELSDQVVMVVRVESQGAAFLDPPLYLRSLVYDQYTGRGWESRGTDIQTYQAGETLFPTRPDNAILVRQQVQFVENQSGFIYTVGDLNSVDQPFKVAWRAWDTRNQIYDVLGGTIEADVYQADSYLLIPDVESLRVAGQSYPRLIRQRYLGLPASVPDRVLSLAVSLTATEANPYDRAVALERYLRQIPYTLAVSTGPAGVDITDYFLFSLQKGYCDYYATAMVVLARAAGLPARFVVGYIGEYYDEENDVYVITADQAHAWAEIYFPGTGWVPFEPTGGRPPLQRPETPFPELPADFELDLPPLVSESAPFDGKWGYALGASFLLALLGIMVYGLLSDVWLSRLPPNQLILQVYRRIYKLGHWAGIRIEPSHTPFRFAMSLKRVMDVVGQGSLWERWIRQGTNQLPILTQALVQSLFAPTSQNGGDSKTLMQAYRLLRWRLWLVLFLIRVYRVPFLRALFWINPPLYIPGLSEDRR